MKTINELIASIKAVALLFSVSLIVAGVNPALAGPDCSRKPEHPNCGGGGPGGEDPPPANPAFAIVGTSSIFLMDIDGSNLNSIFNRKTSRGMDAWNVRWSPDGNRILYDRRYDPSIYTVDPDGSNVQQMDPLYNGAPISAGANYEWRHVDGRERIFFIGGDPNDGRSQLWDIYVIDPQGGSTPDAIRLTDGDPIDRLEWFSVSSDGTRMVVHRCPVDPCGILSEMQLFQLSVVNGSVVATLAGTIVPNGFTDMDNPRPASWSNDSSLMLIVYGAHLAVMEMDANIWTVTPLKNGPVQIPGCVRSPTWSPDDTQIAFDVQCFGNQPKNEGVHTLDFNGPGAGQAPSTDNLQQVTTGLGIIRLDWRPTWTESE